MRVFVYCEGVSMYASEVEREGAWVCDGETGGGGVGDAHMDRPS